MATDVEAVEHLPDFPGSVTVKRLEGTFVAKRSKNVVPDHLTDTKIFSKVKRNGILQCKPAVIHFDGYQVGEVHRQTLRIINASGDNQQMHIIPPTTPNFSIEYYKQRNSLVPGLSLDVTVQFKPTKWQYYYDCIRVHCKGEHNLLIPIHAYPVMSTAQFPQNVTFPLTPVGQTNTKTLSLKCDIPIDFEFELSYLEKHSAFEVTPMRGIITANSETAIKVTFTPSDFSTACMKLQLELSQFNSSPLVCTFHGSSTPGLAVNKVKQGTQPLPKPKKQQLPSLTATRRPAKNSKTLLRSKPEQDEVIVDGIHIPANADTSFAMTKILAQKPGKMKANKLKQVVSTDSKTGQTSSRQVKEAAFLRRVREIANEERANQLRWNFNDTWSMSASRQWMWPWVTNLGSTLMNEEQRKQVAKSRAEESEAYKHYCHIAEPEKEFLRRVPQTSHRRTRRIAHQVPDCEPKFDPYSNNMWSKRHAALRRFVEAARKVVIRLRCQARLERLKTLCGDIQAGRTIQESLANLNKDPDIITIAPLLPRSLDHLSLSLLPHYKSSSESSLVNTTSASEQSAPQTVESIVHRDIPYIDLKVPQECQLMGYLLQPVPAYGSYTSPGLPRPLHSGAQDESISFEPIPGVNPEFLTPLDTNNPSTASIPETVSLISEDGSLILEGSNEVCVQDIEAREKEAQKLSLTPPQLSKKQPVDPMSILNPYPGVTSYLPMMDNSVITLDHVLKPLPAFPTAKYPRVRLDKMDVIPEVMEWKKFPNQYLVAVENQRRLVTVWKPSWTDPYNSELLPALACGGTELKLLTGPCNEDFVDKDSDTLLPTPTMEMVKAQFNLPALNLDDHLNAESDPRLRALTQLEAERRDKFDQLGERIRDKFAIYKDLLNDSPASTGSSHHHMH